MSQTKNVGTVAGLFIGNSAPVNTSLIWYDNTPNQQCHKVYDFSTNSWKALSPDIVANTTYSELVFNAQRNGLSVGKHYVITDKSNTLAIAITSTKVQYVDTLGNILVDDLGTNIQYHVSSSNLLIDDIHGVFNTTTNKLVFSFSEETPTLDTDYVFGKKRVGSLWKLAKFKVKSFLSNDSTNSLSWRNGIFFSFTDAIRSILNKAGGIVGYDTYNSKVQELTNSISAASKNNQTIIQNADKSIANNTTNEAIFGKKLPINIDTTVAPGDILQYDTLLTIVQKIQRWITKFKYATGIRLSPSFADATTMQYVNNNDTIESAFAKVQYILKHPTTAGALPEEFRFVSPGTYDAFEEDGLPIAGDSIFYALAKITSFIKNAGRHAKLSDNWKEESYTGAVSLPSAGMSLDETVAKLVAKFKQIGVITNGKIEASQNIYSYLDLKNKELCLGSDANTRAVLKHDSLMLYNHNASDASDNIYLKIQKDRFLYNINYTALNYNNFYSAAVIRCTENFDGQSCAFQAISDGNGKNTYDAFFSRLKFGSLTFNTIQLFSTTTYQITRDKSFILYVNGSSEGNLFLPSDPEDGLMVLVCQGGSKAFNIHAQGNNGIDTINESAESVRIGERGAIFCFVFASGISYNNESRSGLWEVSKWDNQF